MKFRTEIKIGKAYPQINYESKIALFGSCFSEHISSCLKRYQFQTFTNSHGIVFHPLAIENSIKRSLEGKKYCAEDLNKLNDIWFSYEHHSKFSSTDPKSTLQKINDHIKLGNVFLSEASHVIFTLGTAWVYKRSNGNLVANCHKVPQKEFSKTLLSHEEITNSLVRTIERLKLQRPGLTIILTLSPVRHLKDGFVENAQSKGLLLNAIHSVCDMKKVHYFPSYEIMMDDLRDYRFYEKDLIHPSETAVEYIWEKFKDTWVDESIHLDMKEIDRVFTSLNHKPFHEKSDAHQTFLEELTVKIKSLEEKYPHLSFHKKRGSN
ncbi:GSCFA domain-containing protein [Namhaeicola litoreus]|uniref:GSCFA domain-containing protein n=1 Tax=Namhaeicola litoreus TaxID=1052145 RepID=A0ABW3XY14_9FLAO